MVSDDVLSFLPQTFVPPPRGGILEEVSFPSSFRTTAAASFRTTTAAAGTTCSCCGCPSCGDHWSVGLESWNFNSLGW